MRRIVSRILLASAAIALILYLTGVIPVLDSRFYPSDSPAYVPQPDDSFEEYLAQNQARIRSALFEHYYSKDPWPFGTEYPLERVVRMRAPYQILPAAGACDEGDETLGFLMVHGLTDSPYLLRPVAESLANRFPCALIRGVLNPGHATVPGDLLRVELDDWRRVTRFGIESFRDQVSRLYIVGYSNGAPLALEYVEQQADDELIEGLILLSPGLEAANGLISISPWLRHVMRWATRGEDRDAVKYDSLATNGAAEFFRLTQAVNSAAFDAVDVPVMMVLSGDDSTVVADTSVEFFCNKVAAPQRHLIWYRSSVTGSSPALTCGGVEVVDVDLEHERYLSHSHVGITMPADNEHYGRDGNYAVCGAYSDDRVAMEECVSEDNRSVYGENELRDEDGLYGDRLVRRTSYNALYDRMLDSMACFVERSC